MPKKSDDSKPDDSKPDDSKPDAAAAPAEAPADGAESDESPDALRARLVDARDRYDRLAAENDRLRARLLEGPYVAVERVAAALEVQALALLVPQLRLGGRSASAEKALARAATLADLDS